MKSLEIGAVKIRTGLNRIFPSNKKDFFCSAIITAAGSGQRMGGVSKSLVSLLGIECISYSLRAFDQSSMIREIIVTTRAEDEDKISQVCKNLNLTTPIKVVMGGSTRQESVALGFAAISANSDFVAIHDGARPLIKTKEINQLLELAKRYGSSCASKKMVDTVKRGINGMIAETVPRDDLYTVQTPQVFRADIYRVALAIAQRDQFQGTDDCSLVEHAGFPIRLCECEGENRKMTTPDDVSVIERLLEVTKND